MISKFLACWTMIAAAGPVGSTDPAASKGTGETPAVGQLSGLTAEEQMATPPGSPEDQALWRAGNDVSAQILVERALSARIQWQGRNLQYAERLDALAKSGDPAKARQASELLEKYRGVAIQNFQTATRQWPVDPTRGCTYPALDLQSVMRAAESPQQAAQLGMFRGRLKECLDLARPALAVMAGLNRDLEALQAAAEALLPPLPVAAPPPTGAAAGTPQGAAK